MKPLVLALTVALFATLLNLVSAGTDAGMQVVASYKGYDKRQFPNKPTLACITAARWMDVDSAIDMLWNLAGGNNDQKRIIPLGTPTIIIQRRSSNNVTYCNYVPGGYAGPKITAMFGKSKRLMIYKGLRYAFYAKKAADSNVGTIKATAAKMEAVMAGKKDFIQGSIMVEITATREVYVGPMVARNSTCKTN